MRTLRKLVFGETWTIPIGVALVLVAGLIVRGNDWAGFVLLLGAIATLSAALRRVP